MTIFKQKEFFFSLDIFPRHLKGQCKDPTVFHPLKPRRLLFFYFTK